MAGGTVTCLRLMDVVSERGCKAPAPRIVEVNTFGARAAQLSARATGMYPVY